MSDLFIKRLTVRSALAVLAASLVLAGCGSSSSAGGNGSASAGSGGGGQQAGGTSTFSDQLGSCLTKHDSTITKPSAPSGSGYSSNSYAIDPPDSNEEPGPNPPQNNQTSQFYIQGNNQHHYQINLYPSAGEAQSRIAHIKADLGAINGAGDNNPDHADSIFQVSKVLLITDLHSLPQWLASCVQGAQAHFSTAD